MTTRPLRFYLSPGQPAHVRASVACRLCGQRLHTLHRDRGSRPPPTSAPGPGPTPATSAPRLRLQVVKQCVATDGVQPDYVRAEILPEFFKNFWVSPFAI